jgi:hypothetical protein
VEKERDDLPVITSRNEIRLVSTMVVLDIVHTLVVGVQSEVGSWRTE